MSKLPPNAYRTTINGNPYIVHEDGKGNIIRLEDDYGAKLAKMPVNARLQAIKYPKQKYRKAGGVSNVSR